MRPVVFIDRDGTLNVDQVHAVDIARLELRPGAVEALRLWREAGWRTFVITNQSGIARGRYTEAQMHAFHRELEARLAHRFDGWYFCPHMPDGGCACRKPAPGLLLQAAREHALDLRRAYIVGDSAADVGAGRAAGMRAVLVPAGAAAPPLAPAPDHVAPDLAAAARWTLQQERALQERPPG